MNLTQIVVVAVIVGLIGYDVLAGKLGQPTESSVLRDWAWRFNALPFCAGFLCGHWFFPRSEQWVSGWMLVIPVLVMLLARDMYFDATQPGQKPLSRYPGWFVLAGIPAGMLLWGQMP